LSDFQNILSLCSHSALFRSLPDPAFLVNPDSLCIIEANPICQKVLGKKIEEFKGMNFLELIEKPDRAQIQSIFEKCSYEETSSITANFYGKDGDIVILEMNPLFVNSNQGKILQIVSRELTDQLYAEEQTLFYSQRLSKTNSILENLSNADELSGLYNFRYFRTRLSQEQHRAERYDSNYAIAFFDLDNFKDFNEKYSHAVGDRLLQNFSQLIQKNCRRTDLIARFGSDKFITLSPGVDYQGAYILSDRIRQKIQSYTLPELDEKSRVSVSVGVASFPHHGTQGEDVLLTADRAMQKSKTSGKNRVSLVEPLSSQKAS